MEATLTRRTRDKTVVSLNNVERVPYLDPEALDRRYLRRGRPVIMTALFDGAPIRRLADVAVAKTNLARLPLPIGPNPVHAAVLDQPRPPERNVPFAELYDRFARGALPRMICAEHDLPAELARYFPALPHLQLGDPSDQVYANMFLSGAGNATHLHFDKDLRHDLIYHVLGRKRYVLIEQSETHKLAAGTAPSAPYASTLFLDHLTPGDLLAFIRYTAAWDCVLEPGETLFLPATMWHYVAYIDTALSVHFRLARNGPLMRLAEMADEAATGTIELQALAATLLDASRVNPPAARVLGALEAVMRRCSHDPLTLERKFNALCARASRDRSLQVTRPPYDLASLRRDARTSASMPR